MPGGDKTVVSTRQTADDMPMAERTIPDIATLREICHAGKLAKDRRAWYAASRGVAIYITWLLIHTGVTANQVTLMTVMIALAGVVLLGTGPAGLALTGAGLLLAYHLLDKVDGDVARYRRTFSIVGQSSRSRSLTPRPSLPMMNAQLRVRSTSPRFFVPAGMAASLPSDKNNQTE